MTPPLPKISDIVTATNVARFLYFDPETEEFWYRVTYLTTNGGTDGVFEFPIPLCDTNGGVFLPEDKTIRFMRWIRVHLASLAHDKEAPNPPTTCQFVRFAEHEMWFRATDGFEFPIPIADVGTFLGHNTISESLATKWIEYHRNLIKNAKAGE